MAQAQEAEERRVQDAIESGRHDQLNGLGSLTDSLSIDPILEVLMSCPSRPILYERLSYLFDVMDADGSGAVSFQEMKTGLKKWSTKGAKRGQKMMILSQEEFEHITQGSRFSTDGEMSLEQFQHALELQIRLYVERKMARQMAALAREDPCAHLMIYGLKCAVSDSHEMIGVHRWHVSNSAHPKRAASAEFNRVASDGGSQEGSRRANGSVQHTKASAVVDQPSASLAYTDEEEADHQKSIDTSNSHSKTRAHHLKASSDLVDLDHHRKDNEFLEALPPNVPSRPRPLPANPQSIAPPFLRGNDSGASAPISLASVRAVENSAPINTEDRKRAISGQISDSLLASHQHVSYGQLPQGNGTSGWQDDDPGRSIHRTKLYQGKTNLSVARRSHSAYELGSVPNLD